MSIVMAIVVGALFAAGVYLLLRRSVLRLVLGLMALSHAANLLILSAGGLTKGRPPIVREGDLLPIAPYADPLPQALVLTAIVISFGVGVFLIVLVARTSEAIGADDTDAFRSTDCAFPEQPSESPDAPASRTEPASR
jgi:multicomponent Na+:H+ antiporter subunit C